VGFASRSHFSSRFRQRYGEDPTASRRRARQEADPTSGGSSTTLVGDYPA
jgi:AraC family transcriptional regulator, activator of mtrCDE